MDKILSRLKNVYGNVFSFDELMRQFLNVFQHPYESVTDYVVRLEKAFATIRDNYPEKLEMVDKTQHLRERFYQGLKREIHQKLTPSYEDEEIPYVTLIKRARQLEAEFYPKEKIAAKGVIEDDPQMQDVIKTLRELKNKVQQKTESNPLQKPKWKGQYSCYYCGEPGHWRRTCPQRLQRKRRPPNSRGGSTPSSSYTDSSTTEEDSKPSPSVKRKCTKRAKPSSKPQYYNPDPVARMFGRANEATVEVNRVPTTCLVDTGATVTIINADFCEQLGLEVHSIDGLVSVSATGGTTIPYLGYTVATLEFPHIPHYSEEVVMLVISDPTNYAARVPLQIGTRVIAAVTETLTPEDIKHLDETWKQTYVGTLMSCAGQQRNREDGDTFNMDSVKGPVKLRKEVELEPFEQKKVWGYTQVRGHSKRVVVCTESEDLLMKGQVMSVNTKSDLLPDNSKVKVLLRNLTTKAVKVPVKTTIGEVSPCNVVPPIWKPEEVTPDIEDQTWTQEMEDLFEQLGLNEPKEWMTEEDMLETKKLVQKFHMIFSKNDLDLGKTDKVKYARSQSTVPLSTTHLG